MSSWQERVDDEAGVDGHDVVAGPAPEPEATALGDAPHGGAVAGGGQLGPEGHLHLEVGLAAQGVGHDVGLEAALASGGATCCQSQPAAALGDEGARRRRPGRAPA